MSPNSDFSDIRVLYGSSIQPEETPSEKIQTSLCTMMAMCSYLQSCWTDFQWLISCALVTWCLWSTLFPCRIIEIMIIIIKCGLHLWRSAQYYTLLWSPATCRPRPESCNVFIKWKLLSAPTSLFFSCRKWRPTPLQRYRHTNSRKSIILTLWCTLCTGLVTWSEGKWRRLLFSCLLSFFFFSFQWVWLMSWEIAANILQPSATMSPFNLLFSLASFF